jgi:formiminotetrahydrofolate cyclodeaminase
MPLMEMSAGALLEAFSTPAPTPGGGSASALAGALGASLLAMVAGMTNTREGSAHDPALLARARTTLIMLRDRLAALVDEDAQAYDAVVSAYRLPKGSDAEKQTRKEAIQAALRLATVVPLETMRTCRAALDAGRIVADMGNPAAASDVRVGTALIRAGLAGAAANVRINLPSLTDEVLRAATERETAALED